MITFDTIIEKFDQQGEKTGWTYIGIPSALAEVLKPGNKKAFRVEGNIDGCAFDGVSLLPMGHGDFIMALNASMRKALRKPVGAVVNVQMKPDNKTVALNAQLLECLADEPAALANFMKLPPSHRKYYSNWIETAKTEATKAKRIAQAVTACSRGQHYGEMIRSLKSNKP